MRVLWFGLFYGSIRKYLISFAQVRPRQLARTEKDCVLVELDAEGSEHSQFTLQVCARMAIRIPVCGHMRAYPNTPRWRYAFPYSVLCTSE